MTLIISFKVFGCEEYESRDPTLDSETKDKSGGVENLVK